MYCASSYRKITRHTQQNTLFKTGGDCGNNKLSRSRQEIQVEIYRDVKIRYKKEEDKIRLSSGHPRDRVGTEGSHWNINRICIVSMYTILIG